LLGAHAHGVCNILAVKGDPGHVGNYPHATGIWDVDSIGLVEVLARLNRGEDSSGASIGRRAGFHIGCALTPPENEEEWDRERERLRRKIAAGAHFIMSQPVYDADGFERFMDYLGPLPIPLLVGVMPLNSYRHAEYLHNEVPGITVPPAIRERMARAGENGQAEGIAMARDFLARVAQRVQGTYLMPSFGRYEVVSEVIRGLPGR
jgi:methionine synthase / methylenetetrahydrofolate reductase(NADPH)